MLRDHRMSPLRRGDTSMLFEEFELFPLNPSAVWFKQRPENTCPTCQHQQHLQAIVYALLPNATWQEATASARRGERTLPTKTHQASILRLDISDFTALMDEYPLDQVLTDLDAYFNWLTPVVYQHQGDIYKFLGDGFLAIFNSADEAVTAGVAIQQIAADFNHHQSTNGGLIFPTRLAIDTGPVALTTIGSPSRQDRTVMGMPVNLAERLQALATPGRVWLTQVTFERLSDPLNCRCLGPVEVKGKQSPVIVYEK